MDTSPEERKTEGCIKFLRRTFQLRIPAITLFSNSSTIMLTLHSYSIEECVERGLTYSAPLKAKLKLYCTDPDHEDFDTVIQDVYLGAIPYMTPKGTFVINGAERVIVSQLHRSPGVFFGQSVHANGTKLYSARIIPFRGSWIEFATDINNVMYAYIDRKKKLPVTTLLRAIGFESDKDILEIFNLAEEVKVNKASLKKAVGQKLAARVLKSWIEDFVDEDTGEVVSIERHEVIIDREVVESKTIIIDAIIESGRSNYCYCTSQMLIKVIMPSFIIHCKKTLVTRKKKLYCISIASCVMLYLPMIRQHVRLSIIYSSPKNDMILVM
jgi:DNA-directed RNA polymerase subunit beta